MKSKAAKSLAVTLAFAAATVLTTHAGTRSPANTSPSVTIEPTQGLLIKSLHVRRTADGSLVSGRVEPAFGSPLLASSHVCIEVREADGSLIVKKRVRLTPSGHPRVLGAWIGRSTFATTVATPPDSTMTVSAHSGRHS